MTASIKLLVGFAAIGFTACAGTIDDTAAYDSDHAPWAALEGDALTRELATSPIRELDAPFARLGVSWDADSPTAIEVATSIDGTTFGAWHAPAVVGHEVEQQVGDGAFVGTVVAEPGSRFYRLRGGGGRASYVGIEFLEPGAANATEAGEPSVVEEPALGAAALAIKSRASWGARAAKCSSKSTPDRFTIHHTVTPTTDTVSAEARLRNIQAYHQDVRGWCDIGYNYLVSRDGRVWEGRGANKLGSHVAGQNTGNVGVAFLGTYTTVSATQTQISSAGALIASVAATNKIPVTSARIKGHRDRGTTSCPGDRLYGQIASIIKAGTAGPALAPIPEGATTVKGVVYVGSETSKRVAGATVTLGDRSATTSPTGYFEFAGVEAGTSLTVTASAPGYDAKTVARTASGDETWASVSLTTTAGSVR